jgi:hypothetical protein
MFPTITDSNYLSNSAQSWLHDYPPNQERMHQETQKFIEFNKQNPILMFAEKPALSSSVDCLPHFQILSDKVIVTEKSIPENYQLYSNPKINALYNILGKNLKPKAELHA